MSNIAITARNLRESSLFRLPVELRLRIWEYASSGHILGYLAGGEDCYCIPHNLPWVICPFTDNPPAISSIAGNDNHSPFLPAATICKRGVASGICRTIRSEALHQHMRGNIFHFECSAKYWETVAALPRKLLNEIRQISFGGCFGVVPHLFRYARLLVGVFPNLRRIFITQFDQRELTLALMGDLMNHFLKGRLAGVEFILMDVRDRSADINTAEKVTL